MKKLFYVMAAMICAAMFSGCSSVSPFDYGNNWLIRENDIPQFYSTFDLFYIGKAPAEYGDNHDIQFNWTKTHTNDIFGRGVRVFAPEIRNPDVETFGCCGIGFYRNYRRTQRDDGYQLYGTRHTPCGGDF